MALDKDAIAFGDFSDTEVDQLYSDSKPSVQFSPPAACNLPTVRLGKMSTDDDRSSPVFNFTVANEKEPDIQFGSAPSNATPPINGDANKDQTGVSLNVNANEFVPSNKLVTKGGVATQYPVTEGISPLPLVQPPPHAFYYPYYPTPWVAADPRYVQHAFYPHFGHHGYRYQIPGAMGGPQVAVVSPYRTSGDSRPSIRVSDEKVRGNEYSVPEPLKSHVPLSPNSLPSPPSTHGDSGIDLAQSKSVSPPPSTAHSLPERPLSVNDIHNTVETPPTIKDDTSITDIEPINQTTPTHEITTPTILKATTSRTTESNVNKLETKNFATNLEINKADDHTPKPTPTKQSNKKSENPVSKAPLLKNEDKKTTPTNNKSKPSQTTSITKSANSKTVPAKNSIINNNKSTAPTVTTPTGKKNNVASARDMSKTIEATPTQPSVMSWASIVGNNGSNSTTPTNQVQQPPKKSVTKKVPSAEKKVTTQLNKQPLKMSEEDKIRLKVLGEQLESYSLSHDAVSVTPRGLRNTGNMCYIHAPLQSLICCPSFYHLFAHLELPSRTDTSPCSSTPVTDAMMEFVWQFKLYPKDVASHYEDGKKKKRQLLYEEPFQPNFIYNMLTNTKSCLSVQGRQEDAEEFLCWVLSRLHEEMVSGVRSLDTSPDPSEGGEPEGTESGEDEEWQEVGPRNKSTITRRTSCHESPISKMFGGKLQSTIYRSGMKETVSVEPFFSLPLDIQSSDVHSVKEALEMMCIRESVALSGSTKEVSNATRKITLAQLPQYLILHIKRFHFDGTTTHKINKPVEYDQDLEIPKELIAAGARGRLSQSQRMYKLWSVIYHQGKTVDKGHYICDVYHNAASSWVRVNDNYVKTIPAEFVFNPSRAPTPLIPYLLFYKLLDRM